MDTLETTRIPTCEMCGCDLVKPEHGETIFCNRRCHQLFDEWWAYVDLGEPLEFNPKIPAKTRELILRDLWERPYLYYVLRKLGAIFPKRKLALVNNAA